MDFSNECLMIGKVLLAFVLGGMIGFERQFHHTSAGIRTYAAVAMGACLFGVISCTSFIHGGSDPGRIAAQVVSGVGFIGAGVIFREGSRTSGLTTAATIWVTSAIGLAISYQLFLTAITCTALMLVLLSAHRILGRGKFREEK